MASRNKASANSIAGDSVTSDLKRRHARGFVEIIFITLALTVAAVLSAGVAAQSGRLKDPKAKPKPGQGPVGQPRRLPASQKSPPPIPQPGPRSEAGADVDPVDVVSVSSNLVPIPASVVDINGHTISGLKLEDFELLVDGQVRTITDITRSELPVRLAMLFDNSGSIDFAREFEKEAAKHFFRRVMRPSDLAAIFSVETDPYLAQPMTSDLGRLESTIASFGKPEGGTSLFDAIIDAAAYLRPFLGRRVVLIVSDGIETTSEVDFETTLRRVLSDDCQVFVVQTGLYEGANLRALAAERRMEQLAVQTGGAAFIPRTTAQLETAFKQIAADLAQQYVLSYYQSEAQRDGRYHAIDLQIKSRKDVRVRARKVYYSRKGSSVGSSDW
ncbi:MAG TPA: VWA domain-containing protein [Pyrinomonadaceae bacterium]|nr:VWA domain-containing protein [Pyrinomonadaceae bacterium]